MTRVIYIYIVYISEIKHNHFPGIKTCCYITLEMTPEMSRDHQSWDLAKTPGYDTDKDTL